MNEWSHKNDNIFQWYQKPRSSSRVSWGSHRSLSISWGASASFPLERCLFLVSSPSTRPLDLQQELIQLQERWRRQLQRASKWLSAVQIFRHLLDRSLTGLVSRNARSLWSFFSFFEDGTFLDDSSFLLSLSSRSLRLLLSFLSSLSLRSLLSSLWSSCNQMSGINSTWQWGSTYSYSPFHSDG